MCGQCVLIKIMRTRHMNCPLIQRSGFKLIKGVIVDGSPHNCISWSDHDDRFGTDQLPSLGQNSKHEVHEAEGYRDFRNNPEKAIGARVPLAERLRLGFIPIPAHTLESLDHAELTLEGEILQREGEPFRYGVSRKLNLQEQDGVWVNVPGGRLWQMEVRSEGAENLMLKIENMNLPEGAELRSYVPRSSSNRQRTLHRRRPLPRRHSISLDQDRGR